MVGICEQTVRKPPGRKMVSSQRLAKQWKDEFYLLFQIPTRRRSPTARAPLKTAWQELHANKERRNLTRTSPATFSGARQGTTRRGLFTWALQYPPCPAGLMLMRWILPRPFAIVPGRRGTQLKRSENEENNEERPDKEYILPKSHRVRCHRLAACAASYRRKWRRRSRAAPGVLSRRPAPRKPPGPAGTPCHAATPWHVATPFHVGRLRF